jgi:hypothetical protein
MTRKVFEVGNQSKDDETIVEGKSNGYPKVPVPIKAWTEGPCESARGVSQLTIELTT